MKTKLFIAVVFTSALCPFTSYIALGQNTGINANGASPNVSAMLDVDVSSLGANNKKGLLIPRVALVSSTDAATIPAPATSLIVYNDGTGGLTPAGYFYNSGTSGSPVWVQLLNGGTSFCGSATANYVTKFTSASAICNSIIYDNGTNVGIGTTTPVAELEVVGLQSTLPRDIVLSHYFTGALSDAQIWLRRARGTPSSPYALLSADEIGFVKFRGYDGTTFSANDETEIGAVTTENLTATANGSALKFMTTPNGTVNGLERMRIDHNGNVGIGTTTPVGHLEVVSAVSVLPRGIISSQFSTDIVGGAFIGRKARGTTGSPTTVASGDFTTGLLSYAYDGSAYQGGGQAVFITNGTIAAGSVPTDFAVFTGSSGFGSEKLRVLSSGNVGIGTSAPATMLEIVETSVSSVRGVTSTQYGNNSIGGRIVARKARGTLAAPLATASGDNEGLLIFQGYDGTSFNDGASVESKATENWTAAAHGSNLYFTTVPNGTTARNVWMTLDNSGNLGIGTVAPAYMLDVCGDIRAAGSVYYGGTCGTANGTAYNKPDYVFESNYQSFSPAEVEQFISKQGHLPWLTSAKKEKEENKGAVNVTRMSFETLEAVENMQLQIIELAKQNEALQKLIADMQKRMYKLEKQ